MFTFQSIIAEIATLPRGLGSIFLDWADFLINTAQKFIKGCYFCLLVTKNVKKMH